MSNFFGARPIFTPSAITDFSVRCPRRRDPHADQSEDTEALERETKRARFIEAEHAQTIGRLSGACVRACLCIVCSCETRGIVFTVSGGTVVKSERSKERKIFSLSSCYFWLKTPCEQVLRVVRLCRGLRSSVPGAI